MVGLGDVTLVLHDWLSRYQLPEEGVRLIIEFPSDHDAHRAESAFKASDEAARYIDASKPALYRRFPINGVEVRFAGPPLHEDQFKYLLNVSLDKYHTSKGSRRDRLLEFAARLHPYMRLGAPSGRSERP